ncbi:thiamine phosphate synthase [Ghiorsea bivora]|uniref:thiamine phosphate synthase n=1 Tax=Ghiorsea bivora TaxID=1485545 RepID=UPI00056FDF83|nr:thiamine phosphate synthase [Ghiorsea bivora]
MAQKEMTSGIYGILPADIETELLLEKAEAAMLGGVCILQLRDKKQGFKRGLKRAKALRELTQKYDTTLIINDSIQLALESAADGVHLGKDDAPELAKLRSQAPDDFIIGITARADAQYAKSALQYGADYISFGAVFASHTKSDVPVIGVPRLTKACAMFPDANICAIGGITLDNLVMIKMAGATYAAVISSLFEGSAQDVQTNAENMVTLWNNAPSA